MEFYEDGAGEHRWRFRAANGEIVGASSEGFSSRGRAVGNAVLLYNGLRTWVNRDPEMASEDR